MRRANPASCLVLRGGGTALPVGRGSAAAAALGRLSLLLRHPAQLLWRQPPPTAPGVPRIAGVRALVAEGAMSEARPEKHDGRRHDSQDGSGFLICRVFREKSQIVPRLNNNNLFN